MKWLVIILMLISNTAWAFETEEECIKDKAENELCKCIHQVGDWCTEWKFDGYINWRPTAKCVGDRIPYDEYNRICIGPDPEREE